MRESYCILRSGYVTAGDQQIQHSQIHRWSIDLPRYDDQLSPFVCKEIPTTKPSATVKEKKTYSPRSEEILLCVGTPSAGQERKRKPPQQTNTESRIPEKRRRYKVQPIHMLQNGEVHLQTRASLYRCR